MPLILEKNITFPLKKKEFMCDEKWNITIFGILQVVMPLFFFKKDSGLTIFLAQLYEE
jgi:hypothetical protein